MRWPESVTLWLALLVVSPSFRGTCAIQVSPSKDGLQATDASSEETINGKEARNRRETVAENAAEIENETSSPFKYLYDYLINNGHRKFCSSLRKADIEGTLQQLGTFTLFAPSDESMSLLPGSFLEDLDLDPNKRKEFALRHIVPGNLLLGGMGPYQELTTNTLDGQKLDVIYYPNAGYVASGANVLTHDQRIGNSGNVIHSIEKVLYPPASSNIAQLLELNYDRMARYLAMVGLEKNVSKDRVTVLAPTDEAFRALPWSIAEKMLTNSTFLKMIIENHIIPGKWHSIGLPNLAIEPLAGETLLFTKKTVQSRNLVLVNEIPISQPDNSATNGIVHGITRVILPKRLMDDCKCNLPSTEPPKLTTPQPLSDPSLPERYVAGHTDTLPHASSPSHTSSSSSSSDRSSPPPNGPAPQDTFLRRSPAANPEYLESSDPLNGNRDAPSTTSTTPFPYYNIWDDLVANHNLSSVSESNNQADIPTTIRPSEQPRYFRTRIHSSQPPSSASYQPESELISADQPPTQPPRFGTRRRVVVRPTQRPFANNTTTTATSNRFNRNNGLVRVVTRRPMANRPFPPMVYYADEESPENPATYNPPLLYRPVAFTSTTAAPAVSRSNRDRNAVSSSNSDTYFSGRRPAINDEPLLTTPSPAYLDDRRPERENPFLTTRRPFLRRPVDRPRPADAVGGAATGTQTVPQAACNPGDANCRVTPRNSLENGASNRAVAPSNSDPSTRPVADDPFNIESGTSSPSSYDGQPNRGSPSFGPVVEPTRPRRPQKPLTATSSPVTDYYPTEYNHDLTTPSTIYFDSTRRPATRNPLDLWTTPASNIDDPNSPNYLRRYGAQRPPPVASNTSPRESRYSTSAPYPRYDQPIKPVQPLQPGRRLPIQPNYSSRPTPSPQFRPTSRARVPNVGGETTTVAPNRQSSSTLAPIQPDDGNTIVGILKDPGLFLEGKPVSFLMFKDLLRRANLENLASTNRPITIFLPSDDAFGSVNESDFDKLVREPATLQRTLLRHVINYPVRPDDMRNGLVLKSISNDPVTITAFDDGKKVYANGAPILAATEATNGYVYVLGKVLVDGLEKPGELLDLTKHLEQIPEASIFLNLLKRTNLGREIKGQGPFTLLVPDNDAMNALPSELRGAALRDRKSLQDLIGNHIVNGSFDANKLSRSRNLLPLSSAQPLSFRQLPGSLIVNNVASVRKADVRAKNGIIHLVNQVLVPETPEFTTAWNQFYSKNLSNRLKPRRGALLNQPDQDFGNQLASSTNTQKFINWLERSGILNDLREKKKPFTVIVPSDEAVKRLPKQILVGLDLNPNGLKSLLKYHVIPGKLDVAKMKDGQVLEALDKRQIRFSIVDDGKPALGGAPVLQERSEAQLNFVTVDRVLYPPQGNAYQIISGSPLLQNMTQIINTANLVREFSETGPLTVLAPTDSGFKQLDPNELIKFTRDPKSAREFLLKHVLRQALFTSSIPLNQQTSFQAENLAKNLLTFQRAPSYVSVDGVTLAYADITADNGVIHVLNQVL